MNLGLLLAQARAMVPADLRGPVTFTHPDGRTTTGQAVGRPASPGPGDSFRDAQMTRNKARTLSVWPEGLAFAPAAGQTALWGGEKFTVLGVAPVAPSGEPAASAVPDPATVVLYRVTLTR